MRILVHGSAPWSATGYSVQTGLFAPRLQGLGHDVAVACWYGLEGGVRHIPGPREPIRLYPKGFSQYSMEILPVYAHHFEADVIISIVDAWVCDPAVFTRGERWCPLFPVDCEPLAPAVKARIGQAHTRFVISKYGQRICEEAGLDSTYIPPAYDDEWYVPEGEEIRGQLTRGSGDRYIVGIVAANKGWPPRKSWPQMFEGFKLFLDERPDALLHIHSLLGVEYGGADLRKLADFYEIPKSALSWSDILGVHLGFPASDMAKLYRSFDVLLNPAMGEGFGVPIIEAAACGTPAVTGDWTAMTEATKTGIRIPKEKALRWHAHQDASGYQWIVQPQAVSDALVEASNTLWAPPDEINRRVAEYRADTVVEEHWKPALEALEQKPNRAQRRKVKVA